MRIPAESYPAKLDFTPASRRLCMRGEGSGYAVCFRPAADTATNAFECPSRPFSLSAGVSMNSVRSISAAFGLAIAKSSLVSPDIDGGFEVPRQAA